MIWFPSFTNILWCLFWTQINRFKFCGWGKRCKVKENQTCSNSIHLVWLKKKVKLYILSSVSCQSNIIHCEFLEYWNTQKSVWRILQCFSCLLDERISKIWKKLNSHDGFLGYMQKSTGNSAHLSAHFCPALVCPQKVTMRIQFLPFFLM